MSNPLQQMFSSFKSEAFRLETLGKYSVAEEQDEVQRYVEGNLFPTHSTHKDWIDFLDSSKQQGQHIVRVRILPKVWTTYLNFEIEWGYLYNALHGEEIYLIKEDLFTHHFGENFHDWWMFDGETVVRMNYADGGKFVGGELVSEKDNSYLEFRKKILNVATPLKDYLKEVRTKIV